LCLNPDGFYGKDDKWICQTLVHEMCHAWQFAFGKPGARGYHNRQWAARMIALGLMPTSTGAVAGRITGQHMSDYVIASGPFEQAFDNLAATGWHVDVQSRPHIGEARQPNDSKTAFMCRRCRLNAWGKPGFAEPSRGVLCAACVCAALPDSPEGEQLRSLMLAYALVRKDKAEADQQIEA
jgi:hypothetical protein